MSGRRDVVITYYFQIDRLEDDNGEYWNFTDPQFGIDFVYGTVHFTVDGIQPTGTQVYVTGNIQTGLTEIGEEEEEQGEGKAGPIFGESFPDTPTGKATALNSILGEIDYEDRERDTDIVMNAGIVSEGYEHLKNRFLLKVTLP